MVIDKEQGVDKEHIGPGILDCEIERELRDMKGKKATAVSVIPVKFIKSLIERGKKYFYD